jgi:hypothetical protein
MEIPTNSGPAKVLNHSWVFKIVKTAKLTQFLPGVCSFGATSTVTWMDGASTAYNGQGNQGHLCTINQLFIDLAAGEKVLSAIRSNARITSEDPLLDKALEHVFTAVHAGTSPKQAWLTWMLDRVAPLVEKQKRRSKKKKGKQPEQLPKGALKELKSLKCKCLKPQFVSKLKLRLTVRDVALLWKDHKKSMH